MSLRSLIFAFLFVLSFSLSALAEMEFRIGEGGITYLIRIRAESSNSDEILFSEDGGRTWALVFKGHVSGVVKRPGGFFKAARAFGGFDLYTEEDNAPFRDHVALIFRSGDEWAITEINKDYLNQRTNHAVYFFAKGIESVRNLDFSPVERFDQSLVRAISYETNHGEKKTVLAFRADSKNRTTPIFVKNEFHRGELHLAIQQSFANLDLNGARAVIDLNHPQVEVHSPKASRPPQEPAQKELPQSELPEIPNVMVKDAKGESTSAWELVQSFSRDLVQDAIHSKESYTDDPDLREIEDQILRNLLRAEGGSVKLLAPAGVGKSRLVARLMARIARGDVPETLKKYRFMGFSAASISAGSMYAGVVDTYMNAMVELSRAVPIVWIVDEAHGLAGVGTHSTRSQNALQAIKPDLASGVMKMIFLSTPDEWAAAFAGDPALDRRFGRVDIKEPTGERLKRIQQSWLQKYNHPQMSDDLLREVTRISDEFSSEGAQPSRSTSLLAEIFAEQALRGNTGEITMDDIHSAAKRQYGIDPAELEEGKRRERYHALEAGLQELAGQTQAKETILNMAQRVLVGMQDRNKPRYRLLFGGPKGQGKTEIVKIFAKAMGLPEDNRILMSHFTSPHQVEELKNQIATYVRRNPFTVLFFDEIEKAHPSIQKALLGVLDNGVMTVQVKEGAATKTLTIRLHNTSVFMATNAGQNYIASLTDKRKFNESAFRAQMEMDGLDEFMLDRMEAVVPFFFLSKSDFGEVLRIHLNKTLKEVLANTGTTVTIENLEAMISSLTQKYYQPKMSNRDVLRIVSQTVRATVTQALFNSGRVQQIRFKWTGEQLESLKTPEVTMKVRVLRCEKIFKNF